jgi:hypothetical protein
VGGERLNLAMVDELTMTPMLIPIRYYHTILTDAIAVNVV